ncbi:MAG: MATE family efflux transporter [Clostridiales bacterium]|nr:MATE family efflux transporter [Clostridiales bacterium]MDU3240714.1 MATE family efflux transporter [Clostridiales bacterium]
MENKGLGGVFAKYVSLNILSMLGLSCFIFVDTLCVANGVGSNGLAALNLTLPVYSFMNGIGLMIGMGGATRFAMAMGTGNEKAAKASFTLSMKLALLCGVFFTLIGLFASRQLGALLGADEAVMQDMIPYMRTILLFSLAFMVNNVLVCFVRNDGYPQTAMAAMLTGSFSNIVLDILFVFGVRWGMFGAAFATGIAPVLSMCVLSTHIVKGRSHFSLVKERTKFSDVFRTISLGMSSFIGELSSAIVMLLFNFTILKLAGNIGVAAYGVIANIALIVCSIFTGIAQGVQPIISSQYGKKDFGGIRFVMMRGVLLAAACGIICYLGGVLMAEPIVGIFNESGDAGFTKIALEGIRIYFLAFIPMGINVVMAAVLSAKDQPARSMLIALLRGVILNVVLILVFPNLWNMTGVWMVVPVTELITAAVCGVVQFRSGGKGRKNAAAKN